MNITSYPAPTEYNTARIINEYSHQFQPVYGSEDLLYDLITKTSNKTKVRNLQFSEILKTQLNSIFSIIKYINPETILQIKYESITISYLNAFYELGQSLPKDILNLVIISFITNSLSFIYIYFKNIQSISRK